MKEPRTVTEFKRTLRNVEGMYRRRDNGSLTGRNATGSDATLTMNVEKLNALVRVSDSVCDALDADPKLAVRWSKVERRFAGLPS